MFVEGYLVVRDFFGKRIIQIYLQIHTISERCFRRTSQHLPDGRSLVPYLVIPADGHHVNACYRHSLTVPVSEAPSGSAVVGPMRYDESLKWDGVRCWSFILPVGRRASANLYRGAHNSL